MAEKKDIVDFKDRLIAYVSALDENQRNHVFVVLTLLIVKLKKWDVAFNGFSNKTTRDNNCEPVFVMRNYIGSIFGDKKFLFVPIDFSKGDKEMIKVSLKPVINQELSLLLDECWPD